MSPEAQNDQAESARMAIVPTGEAKAGWISDWIISTLNGESGYDASDAVFVAINKELGNIMAMVAAYDAVNLCWKLDKIFTEALQAPAERAFLHHDWEADERARVEDRA